MVVLKGMSEGMEFRGESKHGLYVACCKGNLAKRPFRGHNEKASKPFSVVYADVWGPIVTSLQRHKHAL
jgi:hypothetical protein